MLFLGVYGGCNWLAAQRTDVGTWFFDWERRIPFLAPMILPYLSIDAFFLIAPFLCRDREELRVFSTRIATAILVAGACFALFPLRFAFDRPAVDGWLGSLFEGFLALDCPFNLFPSLHVTLALILADTCSRHSRGLLRIALLLWFGLTGISTVFTFQHHVVDLAGGLALAAIVFWTIRRRDEAIYPVTRNLRVTAYYAAGTGALALMSVLFWPWGALLIWPALSLSIVTAAYLGAGSRIFGKSQRRVPIVVRILLCPYLAGQRTSLAYYKRQCRPSDAVAPGVWIGRCLDEREARRAVAEGVTAVLDLTMEFDETPAFTNVVYKNIPVLDLTAPSPEALSEAVRFLNEESRRGIVYVHCKIGYSRSAAAVAAWLLAAGHARTVEEAVGAIRRVRPQVIVRPEAMEAIRRFAQTLSGTRSQHSGRLSLEQAVYSAILAAAARVICGAPRWRDQTPPAHQRIYFANHTSHLDFVAIWGSLPPAVRRETRPVVGRDYWDGGPIRRLIARRVLRAVLVERGRTSADRRTTVAGARQSVELAARALGEGASLIIFPEGTRGSGEIVGPFKSGLYHLCRMHPDVELVPVFLENLNRVLPKGETVPLPVSGSIAFGPPIRLRPGEDKHQFLARARTALLMVNAPCTSQSTAISRAS
jgi:1-acyl-sn-glycerol-3-phosphate acyltransferase/membrane-associated phospholipid phosphatase